MFASLTMGSAHGCGTVADGTAYCWGHNDLGMLGDGTTNPHFLPTRVMGGLKFASLAAGWASTCGIALQGAAYCWGSDELGELGDDTGEHRSLPVRVVR